MRNTDYIKQLKILVDTYGISKKIIASKMEVSDRTIYRWMTGEIIPKISERMMIRQIYNGYKEKGKWQK